MRLACAVLFITFYASAQQPSKLESPPLTNDSIVTLAKAGFDESFILQLMRTSKTNFDTSVVGLIALKKAGVSDELIHQMAVPQPSAPAAPAATAVPAKNPPKKHGLFKFFSN